jgi:N-acylglucosamine 2-epimerase
MSEYSDCFATMAFGAYFAATGEQWAKDLSLCTFENIELRKSNPQGQWTKPIAETRAFSAISVPMIDLNLCLELSDLVPEKKDIFLNRAKKNIEFIKNTFFDKERKLLRETIPVPNPEDDPADTFEGRVSNPGHSMECLWFLMSAAERFGDKESIDMYAEYMLSTLEFGWDKKFVTVVSHDRVYPCVR